jgi:hypothetical protein
MPDIWEEKPAAVFMTIRRNESKQSAAAGVRRDLSPNVNLCQPDNRKSCAACCGVYNVPDGTRQTLLLKLASHADLFRDSPRTPDALDQYSKAIQQLEKEPPLDQVIHVCEFAGFVDPQGSLVGCMLHPAVPGNHGIDLRGLCYYGSLACTSFWCPAWEQIPAAHKVIVQYLLEDWHIYGLVASDAGFVIPLFNLLEGSIGEPVEPKRLLSGPAADTVRGMLMWKDSWPFGSSSRIRQSQHYVKGPRACSADDHSSNVQLLLASLDFTFGITGPLAGREELVKERLEEFARVY